MVTVVRSPSSRSSTYSPSSSPRHVNTPFPGTRRCPLSLERRLRWAELIRRVFDADVLHCECGARRRVIATIGDRRQVRAILRHLGLEDAAPISTPSRAPSRLRTRPRVAHVRMSRAQNTPLELLYSASHVLSSCSHG